MGLSSFLPFAFHSLQKLTVPIPVGFIPTPLPIPSAKKMSKQTAIAQLVLALVLQESTLTDTEVVTPHMPTD